VDGFFSLTPRESDAVLALFYTTTNACYPGLEDFLGVSQITAPDAVYHWQARTNFQPLVTAGQKPIFVEDKNMTRALTSLEFDGSKMVFLPPSEMPFVTVAHPSQVKNLRARFGNNAVEINAEAETPALVVVAQTYYHNWTAEIDGQPTRLLRANLAFQAVQMPAGKHFIHLAYHDRLFETGAAVSICATAFCLAGFFYLGCKKESPPA
jgi:hypothetical protein